MNNRRKLIAGLSSSVIAVVLLFCYQIWIGYREAIQAGEAKTKDYASVLEKRLNATLSRADADLQQLARIIPAEALRKDSVSRYSGKLGAELDSRLINFPELSAIGIFAANGDWLYASTTDNKPPLNVSARNYFRLARDNPRADPVFSEVLIARSSGRPTVLLVRALHDAHGAFLGIATASIELERFWKLFQSLDIGAGGSVAIYRSDNFT